MKESDIIKLQLRLAELKNDRLVLFREFRIRLESNELTREFRDVTSEKLDSKIIVVLGSANYHLTYEVKNPSEEIIALRKEFRSQITLANRLYDWLNPEI
jgi:hypothetical protein